MEFVFPVSGVEAPLWLPPLVAFAISTFTSMAGVSGAFLLLPFQVSVLHFVSPAVSPTNMVFNITGTPGGIYRYLKEGRLVWPLTLAVVAGTRTRTVLMVVAVCNEGQGWRGAPREAPEARCPRIPRDGEQGNGEAVGTPEGAESVPPSVPVRVRPCLGRPTRHDARL